MKLVAYQKNKDEDYRVGVVIESDAVADVEMLSEKFGEVILPADPAAFYTRAEEHIEALQKILPRAARYESLQEVLPNAVRNVTFSLQDVRLGMPLGKAKKVICVGKNYQEHIHEMESDIPDYPVLFAKFDNAIIGPEDAIYYPSITEKLDYEVELTVVIGKTASKVSKEAAFDYIAGYTLANDTSARDMQKRTPQWLQGKSLDHTTPVGPWVVTKDEVDNPHKLDIRSYVNGDVRQSSNTEHLIFDIPFLINFISEIMTLEPGDMILTGTPHGVGLAMDPSGLLCAEDRVKLEVEGIGTMENQVKKV